MKSMTIVINTVYARIITILISIGVIIGKSIDRTSGRDLNLKNFIFFDKFLTPDGALYFERALNFLGIDKSKRFEIISNVYSKNNFKITDYILDPDLWEKSLVYPRIFYPLISAIFINFIGPLGILVTSIIVYIAIPQIMISIIKKQNKVYIFDVVLIVFFLISFYSKYNLLANTTESLSTIILLFIYQKIISLENKNNKKILFDLIILILLFVILILTNENEIFVIAILISWITRKTNINLNKKLLILGFTILNLSTWLYISNKYLGNYSNLTNSRGESVEYNLMTLIQLSENFIKSFLIENIQLWVNDQALFIIVVFYFYTLKKSILTYEKILTLSLYISGFILTTLNGSLGSGYRYIFPIVPILIVYSLIEFKKRVGSFD